MMPKLRELQDYNDKPVEDKLGYLAYLACSWNAGVTESKDVLSLLWHNIFWKEFSEEWKKDRWFVLENAKLMTKELLEPLKLGSEGKA